MVKNLYLIRHGQVESRFEGKLVGATNADLSPSGREQAIRLNQILIRKSPDICFSSPMRRCLDTANHAMASLNIELRQLEQIRELDFGEWEGVSFKDIKRLDPLGVEKMKRCDLDFRFPKGESLSDFIERIETSTDRLLRTPQDSVVVFAHGGVIRFMVCKLLGVAYDRHSFFNVNYASVYEFKISDNGAVLTGILNIDEI